MFDGLDCKLLLKVSERKAMQNAVMWKLIKIIYKCIYWT